MKDRALYSITEARELLATIYARFTEGFDASDLVEARSLVDELSGSSHTVGF